MLPAWDVSAGLTAAVALLAAGHRRSLTGQGSEIQIPLSNVAFGVLATLGNVAEVAVSNEDRPKFGNALFGTFGRDFATADGRRVMLVAVTQRHWSGIARSLGLEKEFGELEKRHGVDFTADAGARFRFRDEIFPLVERSVGARALSELAPVFDRNAVCWGEYQTVQEALANDARLSPANPMFASLSQPSGETYLASGFPGVMSGEPRLPLQPAPFLGANTDEILLGELGLPSHEIGRLHDAGLVAGSTGSNA